MSALRLLPLPPTKMPPMVPRTFILIGTLVLVALWFITLHSSSSIFPLYTPDTTTTSSSSSSSNNLIIPSTPAGTLGSHGQTDTHAAAAEHRPAHAESYFEQAFSRDAPAGYDFAALARQCDATAWKNNKTNKTTTTAGGEQAGEGEGDEGNVYLECEGIYLGLTSVISQVKSCLKMAIEAGVGVVLPNIPLRDANNLLSYNQGNHEAERRFGEWFDEAHLVEAMGRACAGLDIITPGDIAAGRVRAARRWAVDLHAARFFREREGFFWAAKPFKTFFDGELARLREEDQKAAAAAAAAEGAVTARDGGINGSTIVSMRADFLLFNIVNDVTGQERLMWDDLGRTLRFVSEPRVIVDKMVQQLGSDRPFFAIHFRGEGDNMWMSAEEQMLVDLDALDRAWAMYRGDPAMARFGDAKPPVYLACGDEGQIKRFEEAGRPRGWNITSKYGLAERMESRTTLELIEALPFDFQAIVDLGILVKSYFFIGIMGSAFSYTVANVRDPLTRYRGSSFDVMDDGGARTHMFPNTDRHGDATMERYACCL